MMNGDRAVIASPPRGWLGCPGRAMVRWIGLPSWLELLPRARKLSAKPSLAYSPGFGWGRDACCWRSCPHLSHWYVVLGGAQNKNHTSFPGPTNSARMSAGANGGRSPTPYSAGQWSSTADWKLSEAGMERAHLTKQHAIKQNSRSISAMLQVKRGRQQFAVPRWCGWTDAKRKPARNCGIRTLDHEGGFGGFSLARLEGVARPCGAEPARRFCRPTSR